VSEKRRANQIATRILPAWPNSRKMLSLFSDVSAELSNGIGNATESHPWNMSLLHYAPDFPYTNLDEHQLKLLLNFTALHTSNSSIFKDIHSDDESCTETSKTGLQSNEFQATVHFMYISIWLIATLGNGIVCFIVWQSSRMQTVTNYFIVNLAVGDMLMAMLCIPITFISLFVLQ